MSLIGHAWALRHLQRQRQLGQLRQSYLLLGPEQVGKTTLALTFAMGLYCESPTSPRPCGQCRVCRRIQRSAYPDVLVIEPGGSSFTIEQVRELEAELPLTPREGSVKTRILCGFDAATREAQNALLKTLEEPPSHALLFLTAAERDLLAPTIISRCQTLAMRPVPAAELTQALEERGLPPAEAEALARQSSGRPGWALRALEDPGLRERRALALRDAGELLNCRPAARLAYSEALGVKDRSVVIELLRLWQLWWHDELLVCEGAKAGFVLAPDERPPCVASLAAGDAARFLRHLAEIEAMIQRNVNLRLALNVLVLRMPHLPK